MCSPIYWNGISLINFREWSIGIFFELEEVVVQGLLMVEKERNG